MNQLCLVTGGAGFIGSHLVEGLRSAGGTAKGGAIFAIKRRLGLPVKFIGVGEKLDDLEPFDPEAYVEALFAD